MILIELLSLLSLASFCHQRALGVTIDRMREKALRVCVHTLADTRQVALAPYASHLSQSISGLCIFHDLIVL